MTRRIAGEEDELPYERKIELLGNRQGIMVKEWKTNPN
jgi:hypothetical protein